MPGIKIGIFCLLTFILLSAPFAKGDDYEDNYAEDENDSSGPVREPRITSRPQTIEVKEGGEIRLYCKGENFEHVGIIWSKQPQNSILISSGFVLVEKDRIESLDDDTTLLIKDAREEDGGSYTCRVLNTTLNHNVIFLRSGPRDPRLVLNPSGTRIVSQGDPLTLTCNAQSESKKLEFSWRKKVDHGQNSVEVPNSKVTQIDDRNWNNTLKFESITRHDTGDYVCSFKNEEKVIMADVRVEVDFPPVVEFTRSSEHSALGVAADLRCIVQGQPMPSQSWYKGQQPIPKVGSGYEIRSDPNQPNAYILQIKKVQDSDYGNYTCFANNSYGQSGSATVEVSGAPSQPLLVDDKTDFGDEHMSYTLVWKVVSSIAIEDSVLKYRKSSGEWTDTSGLRVTGVQNEPHVYEISYTLKNLTSSTDYEAVLLTRNHNGWSKESQVHQFHINGKSYQPLGSTGEKGSSGGNRLLASTSLALFLVFLMKTVSSWQ